MSEPVIEVEKYTASYIVRIKEDGSIFTIPIEAGETIARKATTFDIYQCSKELVSNIENQLLADRIAEAVVLAMSESDPTDEKRARLTSALNERGINPQQ
jgi:hypothetical protein